VSANPELLTRAEAAEYLRRSRSWLAKGNGPAPLPAYKSPVMYSRVVCDAWLRRNDPIPPSDDPATPADLASGCSVYFIESGSGGPIKIGIAIDVGKRLRQIQVGNPHPLAVLLEIPGGEEREGRLHALFREDRIHGEWFRRSPAILTFIARSITEASSLQQAKQDRAVRESGEHCARVARALGLGAKSGEVAP